MHTHHTPYSNRALCALFFLTILLIVCVKPTWAQDVKLTEHLPSEVDQSEGILQVEGVAAGVMPPIFSQAHGFQSEPFTLSVSSSTPGAQIRYTTDFSTPTPGNGILYSGPIPITTTTIVRAIAYLAGNTTSATVTQSYIFLKDVRNQPNTPGAAWPTIFFKNDGKGPYPADYEMDPELVNHVNYRDRMDQVFLAIPTLSLVTELPNLWNPITGIYYNPSEKGSAWERAASVELIDPTGATAGFSENVGIRIHGQASRRPWRTPKKSIRVKFSAAYGNTKLDFKLFDDNDALSKFDNLVLRAGGNYSWPHNDSNQRRQATYITDEFARRTYQQMGHWTPHGTFVHLYINGLYWGLYNPAERLDANTFAAYFGGTEFDYDYIEPAEENNYAATAGEGTIDAWNALQALVSAPSMDNALYEQVKQRMDVTNLADYMLLNHFMGNTDWPFHNWSALRKRTGDDTRFRMVVWDTENSFSVNVNVNVLTSTVAPPTGTVTLIYDKLMTNAEYRQLVADRLYKHVVNPTGVFASTNCATRFRGLANIIDQAIIGESARWGDYARDVYTVTNPITGSLPVYLYSRDLPLMDADPTNSVPDNLQETWEQTINKRVNINCAQRPGILVNQYAAQGWYTTTVKAPNFSKEGGAAPTGFLLTINNNANNNVGDIYYTTDGSDPRQTGGTVSGAAQAGSDAVSVAIQQVVTVKARIFDGSSWSPLHEATFYPPQPFENLLINEINYHPLTDTVASPPVDGDEFEFIELYNKGTVPLRLDNVHFRRGFTYWFPANSTIAPNGYLVLASNDAQFKARYGSTPQGVTRGNLANSGETLELVDALGNLIDSVPYLDVAPWPTSPDGGGPSLSLIHPNFDNSLPNSWVASPSVGGTPGKANGISTNNQPPSVSLTQPSNGVNHTVGQILTLKATASDPDGSITQVAFFDNGTAIASCVDSSQPYECNVTPTLGDHTFSAKATDNGGLSSSSTDVVIHVLSAGNQPPTVKIVAPNHGAILLLGSSVTLRAEANDIDGTIVEVRFYQNGIRISGCIDTSPPYECAANPGLGVYTYTAQVTDNANAQTLSEPVVVNIQRAETNKPPAITLTSPNTGTVLLLGTSVTITADASDDTGVTEVSFFDNGEKIANCTDTTAPYSCTFAPTLGTHRITAIASDAESSTQAGEVTIQVREGPQGTLKATYLPWIQR